MTKRLFVSTHWRRMLFRTRSINNRPTRQSCPCKKQKSWTQVSAGTFCTDVILNLALFCCFFQQSTTWNCFQTAHPLLSWITALHITKSPWNRNVPMDLQDEGNHNRYSSFYYQVYKCEMRISDSRWCTRAVCAMKIWHCALLCVFDKFQTLTSDTGCGSITSFFQNLIKLIV